MRISLCKLLLFLVLTLHMNAYTFTATVDNTHPMLGEQTTLTLRFTYDNLEEYEMEEPTFEDFKLTLLEDTETQESNSTWIATLRYALTPLNAGTLTLPILHTTLEKIDPQYQKRYNKNKYLEKITLSSKPITLQVTPLPKGINVTGEYQLHTSVDTKKVLAGKPVIFTLTLAGQGNIENLDFFTLHIPHTTVYETSTNTNKKEFDIVSDHNYTIPALSLQYYNQSTQSAELLSSQAFGIEVITPSTPQKSKAKILFILLLIFAGLLYYLYRLFSSLTYLDKKATFIKALKKCKTKEELLAKVAPYLGKDRGLDRFIFRLEGVEDGGFLRVKREIMKGFSRHFSTLYTLF